VETKIKTKMHKGLEQLYYVFASVVLAAGLFVVSDSHSSEAFAFKQQMKEEFRIGFLQTMGDGPILENFEIVWNGVYGFYTESADAAIALLTQPETDEDVIYVFSQVYNTFAAALREPKQETLAADFEIVIPANFMQEEPIYNIVPGEVPAEFSKPQVAGISTIAQPVMEYGVDLPANSDMPWVTLRDNITGQLYCTAIYNGEVSTYLGQCKNDYQ
jgi:hypothetical protein